MSKHAPEPWKCEGHVVYFPNVAGGFSLRDCPGAVATARRIVACVNACEGMSDPAAEIAEMKQQRDELVQRNANMQLRINELLAERNTTGVAIDNAICGRLPEQHNIINRLRMIANIAARSNELVAENERLRTALECATNQLREFGVVFVVGGCAS